MGQVFASKVKVMDALKKAEAFMPGQKFEMKRFSSSTDGKTIEEPFYIFNIVDGGGYVLVSAEDQTEAILGYSTKGNIDLNNIPDNLRYWLDFYAAEINAVKEGRMKATPRKSVPARANIEPLLTTKWNQGEPYNLMCPDGNGVDFYLDDYESSNRCVTGCVATAVAQVMYYHKWPEQTTAIPSYNLWGSITLDELPATTLDWNKMKDVYSKSETGEEAQAVAKLMRYVGQAFEMDYGIAENGGSGANIYNDMMVNCFGYSKQIHTKERDYYTTEQWEDMVYAELVNNRPVPYGGFCDGGGGHQFVCDGYKDGLFSLNWGWGGRLDGYFILSIADPDGDQGIGGGSGAFKYWQDAVFNFMPAAANEEEVPYLTSVVDTSLQPSQYTREHATDNFSDVTVSGTFETHYSYVPVTTYNISVGWGIYRDEQFVKCIGSWDCNIDHTSLNPNQYYIYPNEMTLSFGEDLANGRYQLRQISRKAGSSEDWTLMDNYGTNCLMATVSGTSLRIRPLATFTLGDANGDGKTSMTDAMMMISYLLGENPAGFDEDAADLNGDGVVTISDVLILMDMVNQE